MFSAKRFTQRPLVASKGSFSQYKTVELGYTFKVSSAIKLASKTLGINCSKVKRLSFETLPVSISSSLTPLAIKRGHLIPLDFSGWYKEPNFLITASG